MTVALNPEVPAIAGSPAAGDILYRAAAAYTRLPVGSNGQFLKLVGGLPAYAAITEADISDLGTYQPTSEKGNANGYASLDGSGLVPVGQIPSIAITEFLGTAANESALLLLSGEKGDWAVRTDTGTNWVITGDDPSDIGDWTELTYPAAPVTSVAGKTGVVTLDAGDITSGTFADARIAESNVTQHEAALTITEAQISDLGAYLLNVVEDTTPQWGGNVDVNGFKLVSVSNGNIDIEPHGTGNVLLGNFTFDADQTVGAGQDNYVLTYDNGTGLISLEAAAGGGSLTIGDSITSGTANRVLYEDGSNNLAESANLTFGTANTGLAVTAGAATTVPLRVVGAASQSANLVEVNSNGGSGGDIAKISAAGQLDLNHSSGDYLRIVQNGSQANFDVTNNVGLGYRFQVGGGTVCHIDSLRLRFDDSRYIQFGSNSAIPKAKIEALSGGKLHLGVNASGLSYHLPTLTLVSDGTAYLGQDVTNTSPVNGALHGTGGSGTNIAGADLTVAGGKGTGNADGGDLIFQTSDAGGSGTTLQSLSTKMRLDVGGGLFLKEIAAATADVAGFGQLWVKNTTPCELWFTDDAGTDTQIV